jgi:hypothetical protein
MASAAASKNKRFDAAEASISYAAVDSKALIFVARSLGLRGTFC